MKKASNALSVRSGLTPCLISVLGPRSSACRLHDDRWGVLALNMDAAARSFSWLPSLETNTLRRLQGTVGSRPLPGSNSSLSLGCAQRTDLPHGLLTPNLPISGTATGEYRLAHSLLSQFL